MIGEQIVDVIIPVFNGENTIANAINSVLIQKGNLVRSIIVIDDGSTDSTSDQIIKLNSSSIQLVKTRNNGVANARNLGIQLAEANWIAFLDADDIWESDKLFKQLEFAYLKNADFVCGSINNNFKSKDEIVSFMNLCFGNYIATSTVVLRRNLAVSLMPLFNSKMTFAEDYLAWLKCATIGKAVYISSNLATYRLSDKPRYDWLQILKNLKNMNVEYYYFLICTEKPITDKIIYPFALVAGTTFSIVSIFFRFIASNRYCSRLFNFFSK